MGRFNISAGNNISRVRNRNEYYENERLAEEFEDAGPRATFNRALRAYSDAEGSDFQARLIEAVIRTSRGIGDDDGCLQQGEQRALAAIKKRYCQFAATELASDPRSYRDARNMIKILFF